MMRLEGMRTDGRYRIKGWVFNRVHEPLELRHDLLVDNFDEAHELLQSLGCEEYMFILTKPEPEDFYYYDGEDD